jgi:copper chaperone CopZ
MKTICLIVPGLHCANCGKMIRSELIEIPGILHVHYDVAATTVTVEYDEKSGDMSRLIIKTLEDIGYPVKR